TKRDRQKWQDDAREEPGARTETRAHDQAKGDREGRQHLVSSAWIVADAIKYIVPSPDTAADRSLSVIIPAYNESENILATLENVTRAFEPLPLPHEILVIDDGSRDDTAALITANLGRFPHVQLLKNERNMGFGWSYRRGV